VAQVVRYDLPTSEGEKAQKTFRPVSRWPDGWHLCDPAGPWPLYRLPELAGAQRVFVVEGEKCAEALAGLGLAATTSAHGSQSAGKTDWGPLAGKEVILLPDNDDAGRGYVREVGRILSKLSPPAKVKVLDLPFKGRQLHDDVVDWLSYWRAKDKGERSLRRQLERLADAAAEAEIAEDVPEEAEGGGKQSQATRLVGYAKEALDLFHNPEGLAYATTKEKPHQTFPLRRKAAKQYLSRLFYVREKVAPGTDGVHTAINTLEGIAFYDGPELPVSVRLAEHEGRIYLDLGGPEWNAVEIGPDGWRVVDAPPVKFQRSRGMLALPTPARGGSLDELRRLINVAKDEDWMLLLGWLVAALRPRGPFPVVFLGGEQGSCKSTAAHMLRNLVDPNSAPPRSEPKDPRDLIIAATNSWVLTYDNLSHVPGWLSDGLCRLATGGGYATRELYTDSDEVLFEAARPVVVNGIEDLATRGDLLDRALIVTLPAIKEEDRRTQQEVMAEFEKIRPGVLGALLDVVAAGLRSLPGVELKHLPRMADFAKWVVACEPALGWEPDSFLRAYRGNVRDANELALGDSPLVAPLRKLLQEQHGRRWVGTASELLDELRKIVDDKTAAAKDWPKGANVLSNKLRRLAPNLRKTGLDIESVHTGCRREITVQELGLGMRPKRTGKDR
jgi:hypothetical protein